MAKVSIGITSTEALGATTSKRRGIYAQNLGSNNVWFQFGGTASVDVGFVLRPNGEPLFLNCKGVGAMAQAFMCIAENSATDIAIYEIL